MIVHLPLFLIFVVDVISNGNSIFSSLEVSEENNSIVSVADNSSCAFLFLFL